MEPGVTTSEANDDLTARLTVMTTIQLKEELKKRKLKTAGLKNELILRLLPFMQLEHGEIENHDDIEDKKYDKNVHKREQSSENDVSSSDEDEVPIHERRRKRSPKKSTADIQRC